MMRKLSILLFYVLAYQITFAQEHVITTAVPFLLVAGDARSAGMGDNGVATTSDAFSQQYNPAKYAFSLDKQGFSANYTPYLTQLVNDISLGQVTYFNRYNERSAVGASLRYFSLGEIQLTDINGEFLYIVKPNELALDVSYALKFYNFDANFFASISLLISEFLLLYHVLIPVKMFNIKTNQTYCFICLASFICLLFLGLAKYIINLYSIILVFIIGVLLLFSSFYRPVK